MEIGSLAWVAAGLVAFALVSARASRWAVTMPMTFVVLGALTQGLGLVELDLETEGVLLIGEVTLAIILFSDAVRIDLRALRRGYSLPARLLGIGLPLTVALGAVMVALLLPALSVWEAALVAAVLAPTDAALGQAVVEEESVPVRVRQGLNVESGLNDGMVVPLVTLFLALAAGEAEADAGFWATFVLRQVGLGLVIGVGAGAAGGLVLRRAIARGDVEGIYAQLATLAIGFGAFAGALAAGANGFIAAFVAGLSFGACTGDELSERLDEYSEDTGRLLAAVAFFLFGNLFVLDALDDATVAVVVCAVGSLTIGRMLPVAISLIGMGQNWRTTLFLGWFGPRGLASILFGLLLIEEDLTGASELFAVIALTVVISVFAHGMTASPVARRYGRWYADTRGDPEMASMPESAEVPAQRPRWGLRGVAGPG